MHHHLIKTAVFDIDGTLALMDKETRTFTALAGAIDAIKAFRDCGVIPVAYTNGTFFPPQHYYPLLADAGIDFDEGCILTPASVAAQHLSLMGYKKVMVMGAEGTRVPLENIGIEVVPAKTGIKGVEAVLLGWTRDFGAEDLEAVVQAVWDGAPCFAGSIAPYFAGANGRLLGISGAIAAAVENATDIKVKIFGKPEIAGLEMISDMTNAGPEEMMVIGDDPSLEIKMGRKAGAFCVGVTTGISDKVKFMSFHEHERANLVLPSLEKLPEADWFNTLVKHRPI